MINFGQNHPCHFSETEDSEQVLEMFFNKIDKNHDMKLSMEELLSALNEPLEHKSYLILKQYLEEELENSEGSVDLETFKKAARKAGIAGGQRIKWVRQFLNLEGRFARLLKVGDPLNEFSGMLQMSDKECEEILQMLIDDVRPTFKAELKRLKDPQSAGSGQIDQVRSKFAGPVGKFGDTQMFQEGLESQVGNPDPFILKGILREHVSTQRKVTSNYKIDYSDEHEYVRVFGHPSEYIPDEKTQLQSSQHESGANIPIYLQEVARGQHPSIKGPSEAELRDLEDRFKELRCIYGEVCERNNGTFPGESGDIQVLDGKGYIYCEVVESNHKKTLSNLREVLLSKQQQLDMRKLETVLREPTWCSGLSADTHPATIIEQVVKEAEAALNSNCADSRIIPARRRVGLRELMEISVVKEAGLRVEEAVQAYQYTGPLFQVLLVLRANRS